MESCTDCGSEIRPNKENCTVCEMRKLQEKLMPVSITFYDLHVIIDSLEFSSKNCKDGEKQKEFRQTKNRLKKFLNPMNPV
jgi:hypothetical protein